VRIKRADTHLNDPGGVKGVVACGADVQADADADVGAGLPPGVAVEEAAAKAAGVIRLIQIYFSNTSYELGSGAV